MKQEEFTGVIIYPGHDAMVSNDRPSLPFFHLKEVVLIGLLQRNFFEDSNMEVEFQLLNVGHLLYRAFAPFFF